MKCQKCDGKDLSCEECGGLGEIKAKEVKSSEEIPAQAKAMLPILPDSYEPL